MSRERERGRQKELRMHDGMGNGAETGGSMMERRTGNTARSHNNMLRKRRKELGIGE